MENKCKYKERCNQGDLGSLEACKGTYEKCIIYQRFESLKPKKTLEEFTYEDWLGVGAMVKLPKNKIKEKELK